MRLGHLDHRVAAGLLGRDLLVGDLEARPKERKIQVTWTKVGDEAVVQRSELGPNQGFVEIGRTTNAYATFLDDTVELETDYYYRIFVFEAGNTNRAVREITALADLANQYISQHAPWAMSKEEGKRDEILKDMQR